MPRNAADPSLRPRREQQALTRERLYRQLRYTLEHSPFYRARAAGLAPLRRPEDAFRFLCRMPVTTRADLEAENEAFRAVPMRRVSEVVATSGTTGAPISLYLTGRDLDRLGRVEAYSFAAAGFGPSDVIQLCVTLDNLFMAGLAYYLGLRRLGCTVLRQGPANPARQLDLMRRHGVTGIVTVPSFLNALGAERERQGRPASDFRLRAAVLVGENLRQPDLSPGPVAGQLLERWPVRLFGNFGNTEMSGSFCECEAGCGTHIHPGFFHAEVLDETGRPCPAGRPGALVVTPLGVEGTPLLRYRTGDLAAFHDTSCRCGRRSLRLGPILSREGQMLKVKGTKLYPSAISNALLILREVEDYVIIADRDRHGSDRVEVLVAVREDSRLNDRAIAEHLFAHLKIHPGVQCATAAAVRELAFPPGYRKRRTFIDRRPPPEK